MRLRKKISKFVWFVLFISMALFIVVIIKDVIKRSSDVNTKIVQKNEKNQQTEFKREPKDEDVEGFEKDFSTIKQNLILGLVQIKNTNNPIKGIRDTFPDATVSDIMEILDSWNLWRDPLTGLLEPKMLIHQDINMPYDKDLTRLLLKEYPDLYKNKESVKSLLFSYKTGSEKELISYDEKMNIIFRLSETMREDFIKNDTDPDIQYMMCDHYYSMRNESVLVSNFSEDMIARIAKKHQNMKIFREKILAELEKVKGISSKEKFEKELLYP